MLINIEEFTLQRFKQVNLELLDTKFYGLDLDLEDIEIEVSFRPFKISETEIELFLHLRYLVSEGEDDDDGVNILHTDFVSEYTIEDKKVLQVEENETFFDLDLFIIMLTSTVSMARGYLVCQTKGTNIGDFILPLLSTEKLIENSSYKENNLIKLEDKVFE